MKNIKVYSFKKDTPIKLLMKVVIELKKAEAIIFIETLCCLATSSRLIAMEEELKPFLILSKKEVVKECQS